MYVERYGDGPYRFLGLHGWNGVHHTFEPLVAHLSAGVSFYAPDLPGCGRSAPPAQWRLEAVAAEISALIVELARPDLTLVGNCSGGLLGLCAALRLEESSGRCPIKRAVLIDPLAYWPWYFRIFLSPAIGKYAYLTSFENPFGRRLVNLILAGKRQPGTDLAAGFSSVSSQVTLAYLRMLKEIEGPERFSSLRFPIDIVYGERTFDSVRKSACIFRRIWPQARLTELPQAGHLPLLEAPEAVAQIIMEKQPCRET